MKGQVLVGLGLLMAAIGLSGCTDPASSAPASLQTSAEQVRPTVVALIDSGINPYHVAFNSPDASLNFSSIAPNVTAVRLSNSGSFDARVQEDSGFWSGVQEGQLYGFAGTHVLAITLSDHPDDRILDEDDHGTRTASLVARYSPSSVIVMVQVNGAVCLPPVSCLSDPSIARGVAWAASQPWIDVISVSAEVPGDLYDPAVLHPETKAFLDASRLAAQNGKLLTVASGNEVTPSLGSERAAPPWIICVGGAVVQTHGEATSQNRFVDVVANSTELVAPATDTANFTLDSGTSYSTPIVAATLAQSIQQARSLIHQASGIQNGALVDGNLPNGTHLRATASNCRAAMNASARIWNATDWNPTTGPSPDPGYNLVVAGTLPVIFGPGQVGWGYVDSTLSGEITRRVLAEDFSGPSPATIAYMGAYATLRDTLWS